LQHVATVISTTYLLLLGLALLQDLMLLMLYFQMHPWSFILHCDVYATKLALPTHAASFRVPIVVFAARTRRAMLWQLQ
jgi:hypothetical protein